MPSGADTGMYLRLGGGLTEWSTMCHLVQESKKTGDKCLFEVIYIKILHMHYILCMHGHPLFVYSYYMVYSSCFQLKIYVQVIDLLHIIVLFQ